MNPSRVERILTNLYRAIKSQTITREFLTDEGGVTFLAGSQGTNHVWIAFRIQDDATTEVDGLDEPERKMTFRVIRLQPDRTESFGVSRQTGQMEKQSKFTGCRYLIGDVHVNALTNRETFGTALRQIQATFQNTAVRNPMHSGQIMGARSLTNLYFEWVADEFHNER